MSRLRYYAARAKQLRAEKGFFDVLRAGLGFLFRRRFFISFAVEAFEYWIVSRFRSVSATIIRTEKIVPLGPKVMIYVSFQSDSKVEEHVLAQLKYFEAKGYSIIFVTTSPELSEASLGYLRPHVSMAIHRKNIGYDFVSYRVGYAAAEENLESIRSLVVMNDSCSGPTYDFSDELSTMEKDEGAVWGITKSHEIAEYIQSYFFHFGAKTIRNRTADGFFSRVRILHSKWAIVRYLEIKGSLWLSKRGVELKALIDPSEPAVLDILRVANQTDPTRNPAADILIGQKKLPFRKRSLT